MRSTSTPQHVVTEGYIFRPVSRADRVTGEALREKVVWQLVKPYAESDWSPWYRPARTTPDMRQILPLGGRVARTAAVSPLIETGNLYAPRPDYTPWVGDFIEECAAFSNGAHNPSARSYAIPIPYRSARFDSRSPRTLLAATAKSAV